MPEQVRPVDQDDPPCHAVDRDRAAKILLEYGDRVVLVGGGGGINRIGNDERRVVLTGVVPGGLRLPVKGRIRAAAGGVRQSDSANLTRFPDCTVTAEASQYPAMPYVRPWPRATWRGEPRRASQVAVWPRRPAAAARRRRPPRSPPGHAARRRCGRGRRPAPPVPRRTAAPRRSPGLCRARRHRGNDVYGDVDHDHGAQQLLGPARGAPGPDDLREAACGGQQAGQPEDGSRCAQLRRLEFSPEQGQDALQGQHRVMRPVPHGGAIRVCGGIIKYPPKCTIAARARDASGTDATAATLSPRRPCSRACACSLARGSLLRPGRDKRTRARTAGTPT